MSTLYTQQSKPDLPETMEEALERAQAATESTGDRRRLRDVLIDISDAAKKQRDDNGVRILGVCVAILFIYFIGKIFKRRQ